VPFFDKIYKLKGVPVATVQLRFDGWVTELADMPKWDFVRAPLARWVT
jgi:zeta-carotene desaturase